MPRNHGDVSFTQSDVTGTATGIIYGDVNYIHNEGNAALTVNETSEERQKELEARWKESGTCEWLKETKQEFSTWINMENKYCFLWIHGLRGCGKTTLMSRVIAHVREQRCNTDPENIHLLFFYIGYGNDSQKKNTYRNMLMAFWDQAVKERVERVSG
ncbi:uncharacterized protein K452DRAFT_130458 [Aplosporella prunicola CBS 121167]|uniref:Nephrocystin 3-like N-terminal domain-containing protein n=1 Tax=Aplosporella prunicola CBS 121167 TaxID=1176127 RepID=A0A6A6B077_9PEZI|nr:uncharacterized protein K452DRAFT_130458 [Aplosporella prunicola CBS 121167]KAF2136437.1 hypothetical protein K452DRAFT_130458 [Aplosporella prunicola CBS 121167]